MAPGPVRAPSGGQSPVSPRSYEFSVFSDHTDGSVSNGTSPSQTIYHHRTSSKRLSRGSSTNISNVVSSLKHRSGDELGPAAISQLVNAKHTTLLDWIRGQRLTLLPPEGSDYDKVLAWAQLFIERLHLFDLAIGQFESNSYLAAQLSYGYCAMLLELGKENASALTTSFGFFYSISMTLLNLLERSELFTVNQEISEQLVLALGDLVTLVASVSTLFHKTIQRASTTPVSIDIRRTFSTQIRTFSQRCEAVSISMWKHQLSQEKVEGCGAAEINAINSWLRPADRVVAGVADSTSHLAHDREELTCLWVGPYLARFLKSQMKTLAISGKPGSGKTVLASVIVDHMQHPIGGDSYSTIYVPINARIQTETSTAAIARAILGQLFAQRIGNVQLFQIVNAALERSKFITDDDEYDDLMWHTVEKAIASSLLNAKDLVLVIDGIDESSCGEKALMAKLTAAASKSSKVKLITLGAEKPSPAERQASVVIDKELIFDDVCAVVRSQLALNDSFSEMTEMNQETVVTRITDASGGSFLWSKLVAKSIRGESTADGLRKAVDVVVSSKPTVSDLVSQIVQKPKMPTEAKHMLLWLATVHRPLQVKELETLLSVNIDKRAANKTDNIDVLHSLKPVTALVFLQNGLVYLRHGAIRSAVLEIFDKGKLVPDVKDRHADIVSRLLVYFKTTVTEERDVSLQPLEEHDANTLLSQNVLLDFALRYWPLHFKNMQAFTKNRQSAAKQFLETLPTSSTAILLQEVIWAAMPTPVSYSYTSLTLTALRDAFTVNHAATLQSTIVMAQLLQQLNKVHEASTLFYQAAMASNKLYTSKSQLTMKLMRIVLDMTSDQVTTSKTNVMTMREECLVVLVECYKFYYGATSESVVTIWRQLCEHYRMVKEVRKAQEYESRIQAQTKAELVPSDDISGNLAVKLRARSEQSPVDKNQTLNLDVEYDEKVDSAALSIQSVHTYMSSERHELVEQTYLEYWMREVEESRISMSTASEERKIKAMFEYCKFLESQNRNEAVASILSSFWQDSQRTTTSINETSVVYFQEIAEMLRTIGHSTTALSIYESCLEYYESISQTHSASYKHLRQTIQGIYMEVLQSLDSFSAASYEPMLVKLVNEAIQSVETVDQSTFTALDHLLKLYSTQHRCHDATRLLKRVLHSIWPALFATSLDHVLLPAKHVHNCLSLADRLSHSYAARRRVSKEQDTRVRIYRALRSGRPIGNKARQNATTELLRFYEATSQTELAISVHQELLQDYIDHYGPEHAEVVQKLWTLAELTRPRPIFIDYYQQLIRILNKDSKICAPQAFDPAVIVAAEFWNQSRHTDAVQLYKLLFNTFLEKQTVDHRLKEEHFVQEVFTRYTYCLRAVKTGFATLHSITTSYREKTRAIFGASASITVMATLTLARLCQESELYEQQAIELYEELSKIKSSVLNQREISAILNAFYEEQTSSAFSNLKNNHVSGNQVQAAAAVIEKRLSSMRQTYGWAHEESLSQMKKIAVLYATHQQTEQALAEITETTTQILSSTTSTTALATAASAIASSYIAVGHTHKAIELTDEVYRQVIMQDFSHAGAVSFNLESKQQHGLVFLAQMKYSLSRSSTSVTEILVSLTREHIYFQEFRRMIKSRSSSLHSMISSASSLFQFLKTSGREDAASKVILDLKEWFIATEGRRIQWTDSNQIHIFLVTMMEYLKSYKSKDFTRSVGIAGNKRVVELLKEQKLEEASNLAIACYKYMSAQKTYRTSGIVKFVFSLGLNICGRGIMARVTEGNRRRLLSTSSLILQDALGIVRQLELDLSLMEPEKLNHLIGVLGDHQDHQNLAWLLTILWNNREMQRNWKSNITLALGCRYIMARYLVGDTMAAVRLAEDVVYNCRRVHGARHGSTIEMSVLLSQLYTGIAQKYQSHKDGAELARRYYKKSAFIHENILRAFVDPTVADVEMNLDSAMSMDAHPLDLDPADDAVVDPGEHVREHFKLLKLAVERLGDWPKDYGEYEKLSADLHREFPQALKGFEGVEKWNLKSFGGGKAESNDDQLDAHFNHWQLDDTRNDSGVLRMHTNGMNHGGVGQQGFVLVA